MKIILVLGNRNPSITKKRVDRALEYFNSSPKEYFDEALQEETICQYLLFSGGSSDGISKPEGAVMMESLVKDSIPEKFCLIEKESRNTIENLVKSRKLIESLFGDKVCYFPTIVVCTSSFHIKRSAVLASFILKDYPLEFIHTNEEVTPEEHQKETKLIDEFLSRICSTVP